MPSLHDALTGVWRKRGIVSLALWPLSLVYRSAMALRTFAYHSGLFKMHRFNVPVVVVGNISVGGAGKTPVVAAIACTLREWGWSPGIVSRGYGSRAEHSPQAVTAASSPERVGDEPVLLARRTRCPVLVGPDRPAAVRQLLAENDCNIVISDDGLQHLALWRDIEVAVVDSEAGFGNGFCLPAGPLREPVARLEGVDFVISNGKPGRGFQCTLEGDSATNLVNTEARKPLANFNHHTVHAVAGIGRPVRFFDHLRRAGIRPVEHPFPDHYRFCATDLAFAGNEDILMTEKDAVKCESFARDNMWYVPVDAILDPAFYNELVERLRNL